MAGMMESPLLIRNGNDRSSSINDPDSDVVNNVGSMGYCIPPTGSTRTSHKKLWEFNYHEAAIFLQEGENNDKYYTHPQSFDALPAYQIAHHKGFYLLDLFAAMLLLFLAACERPAVPFFMLPVGVHGSLEIFGQLILALELGIRLRWLGLKTFFTHKRTVIKTVTLFIMFVEAVVVLIRQSNHFRVTRALRPLFLIDTYYFRGVRRISRQILQSLPPILDMIFLLLFFMLIFSILGFYLFSQVPNDIVSNNFLALLHWGYSETCLDRPPHLPLKCGITRQYFSTLQDSFISLFVLLTTANYPDVMMPAYAESRWNAAFFIVYLALVLYFLMNLLLAVVYDTFSGLEKRKLKRLFFHKRTGCQHAFRLLVTKQDTNKVNVRHFLGMMKYFRPQKRRRDAYLTFKCLNTNKDGKLSLEEFYHIYDVIDLQWSAKIDELNLWSASFKSPYKRIFKNLHLFVNWKWFDWFIYLVIAVNFFWILTETIQISSHNMNVRTYNFTATWASIIFICVYILEACLKILAKGPLEYFTTGWDLFDFLVTITSVIGLLGEFFNDSFYYVTVLRPFRLLRLFKIKRSYRDVLGTLFVLFTRLLSLMVVVCLVYYFFAIIGMEVFLHVDLKNCCVNTTVEDFYRYTNETEFLGYYYLNDFSNIMVSGVTLFELTVVNNWFIIMEGYAHHVGGWSRTYFMLFYIVMMVVMTIVVAFILELFLFRIQYRRKLKLEDIDDHAKHKVELSLSEDELVMCDNADVIMTGQHILLIAESPDIPTPHLFKGVRYRSKDDFSLRMYSDEVKSWIEEDQNKRDDVINSMTELRHRDRPNADARIISQGSDSVFDQYVVSEENVSYS